MATKQDIVDVLEGTSEHSVAIFAQSATLSQMERCGCFWPDTDSDPEKMAALSLQTFKQFGIPTAHVPFTGFAEAKGLGCTVNEGKRDRQQSVARYRDIAKGTEGFPDVDDYLRTDDMRVIVKATEILGRSDVFTVGFMCAPSALAATTFGMEKMLMCMVENPDYLDRLLDELRPYTEGYRDLLSKTSDGIMVIDCGSTDLTPPELFDRFIGNRVRPYFKGLDGTYGILHYCGDSLMVAAKSASLGEDVLYPEASKCREEYASCVNGRVLLAGGVNTMTMFNGTTEDVKREAKLSQDSGFNFIGPECGVPVITPDENMRALAKFDSE